METLPRDAAAPTVPGGLIDLPITFCARPPLVTKASKQTPHFTVPLLEQAGYDVRLTADGPIDLQSHSVVWLSGNIRFFPKIRRQLIGRRRHERPLVILWHTEPLPAPRASGLPWPRLHLREIVKIALRDLRATDVYTNYQCLRDLTSRNLPDILVVSTPARREFLAERGIESSWVPLGWHPGHGADLGIYRDVDVLFLGNLQIPRRRRMITRLKKAGIELSALGSWSDPAYHGEARIRLLNRTKILLNIQRYPGELPGLRLILAMANRALVISEPIYRPAPFIPGQHYVEADIDSMAESIRFYLEEDRERERIAANGHRLVTEEITLARSAGRILELIRDHVDY